MKVGLSIWFQILFSMICILYFFFTNPLLFKNSSLPVYLILLLGLAVLLIFSKAKGKKTLYWIADTGLFASGLVLVGGFVLSGPFFFLALVGASEFLLPLIGYMLINVFSPIFRGMDRYVQKRAEKISKTID